MRLTPLTTVADESRTMLLSGLTPRPACRELAPLACRSSQRCRSPVYRIPVSPPTPSPTRDWKASKEQLAKMANSTKPGIAEPPAGHRLVIVEGIMGSGKSTTMRFIAKHLQDSGQPALPIHERTEPHPVRATDELEHWFEPWRDATPQHLADRALFRWSAFVEATRADIAIPVMDGQLFHGDLTNLLLMEAESPMIAGYVQALAAVIAPLN